MLTVGGLFSGIGGWELGLERAGMRVLWHCEQDPYCQRVLARHWPGIPCYPDVRELRGADVKPVDVLCGGFPCQDISYAGAGAGLAGERSGLWREFARLIGELRPRYVLVENVPALTHRGLDVVIADLAARGFDAEWDCLPASAFGAPHRRDRIWLVAYTGGDGRGDRERGPHRNAGPTLSGAGNARQLGGDQPAGRGRGGPGAHTACERARDGAFEVADSDDAGRGERRWPIAVRTEQPSAECGSEEVALATGERRGTQRARQAQAGADAFDRHGCEPTREDPWAVEPDVGRVAHGVPARVDRLRSLGNALVPDIAEWIGRRILEWETT